MVSLVWHRWPLLLLWFFLWSDVAPVLVVATSSSSWNQSANEHLPRQQQSQQPQLSSPPVDCGLYVAPSTLGEGAGLGVFYTGQDNLAASTILQEELVVPLLFRDWQKPKHFQQYPYLHNPNKKKKKINHNHQDGALWFRYIWEREAIVNVQEEDDDTSVQVVFVPGIGCTVNSFLDMANIESAHGARYNRAGIRRGDPGAGAFTPYHGSVTRVKPGAVLEPGMELFADYGDAWIPDIPGVQITLNDNMNQAEDFLRQDYLPFVTKQLLPKLITKDAGSSTQQQQVETQQRHDRLLEGLWNLTRDFPLHPDPKVFSVLPKSPVTWADILDQYQRMTKVQALLVLVMAKITHDGKLNTTINSTTEDDDDEEHKFHNNDYSVYKEPFSLIRYFLRQQGKRSLEYLQQNGKCWDHMRPGISSIANAGRGAFASRDLPQGTIVGYAPLIHVGTHGYPLYSIPYNNKHGYSYYKKLDLIVNYAFGHANSTVLLSPYGSMVNYINHAPPASRTTNLSSTTTTTTTLTANVRIAWPQEELLAHKPSWLQKDVHFLTHAYDTIGLSFDYIALRDIQEGEEILMDYGIEFEQAWERHLTRNWKAPADADTYVHSSEYKKSRLLRTVRELAQDPYPPNLQTLCIPTYSRNSTNKNYYDYYDYNLHPRTSKNAGLRPKQVPCQVLRRRKQPQAPPPPPPPSSNSGNDPPRPSPPNEKATPTVFYYTVELELDASQEPSSTGTPTSTATSSRVVVHKVPRHAIFLTDRPQSQDWHLPHTFRHPIMIPNDIFPESWKNGGP